MTITTYEKFGSPIGQFVNPVDDSGSSFVHTFVVLGTDDSNAATQAVANEVPASYAAADGQTLIRHRYVTRPTGPDSWEIEVHYGPEEDRRSISPPDPGEWRFDFDTTGATQKITQSLQTIADYEADPADPAPDLKQAIGWDGKKVNGVEIVVPKLSFGIVAAYTATTITMGWMKTLAANTGRTNNATWLGFAAGEVLYLGAVGNGYIQTLAGTRSKPIEVHHKFEASANLTGLAVGDMTGIAKKGFEYLWVRYKDKESGDATNIVPVPTHAYVERVYESFDFAAVLGITDA